MVLGMVRGEHWRAVVGDALVAARVFSGALVTVGGLEMVLGMVRGEHWRAVLLVVSGQWTCSPDSGGGRGSVVFQVVVTLVVVMLAGAAMAERAGEVPLHLVAGRQLGIVR